MPWWLAESLNQQSIRIQASLTMLKSHYFLRTRLKIKHLLQERPVLDGYSINVSSFHCQTSTSLWDAPVRPFQAKTGFVFLTFCFYLVTTRTAYVIVMHKCQYEAYAARSFQSIKTLSRLCRFSRQPEFFCRHGKIYLSLGCNIIISRKSLAYCISCNIIRARALRINTRYRELYALLILKQRV